MEFSALNDAGLAISAMSACAIGIQTYCVRALRGILHATHLALISEQLKAVQSELQHLHGGARAEEGPG